VTYHFAVGPDVHVRDLADWYLLNTRLQRITGSTFRVRFYDDFTELHRAFAAGRVDLAYANASDTAELLPVGFLPLVRPIGVSDEATIIVAADDPARTVEDLVGATGLTAAATDAPDVHRICRILLEPADLDPGTITVTLRPNYTLVAKSVLDGESRAAFLLRTAYDDLSTAVRTGLRPLISSQISVISHTLLAAPSITALTPKITDGLLAMNGNPADAGLLARLGAPSGWGRATPSDMSLLVDVINALA
jgi:phosphonate transport system substrate-binding protein